MLDGVFGRWDEQHGLPVFVEQVHPHDPVCHWDPVIGPTTNRHWCALGNRRLQVVFDNAATAAVRDTDKGIRWLTPPGGGTGATLITEKGESWASDLPRWPGDWAAPDAPTRTWGPTWLELSGAHDGIALQRLVGCPEGEQPWLVVRVRLFATARRTLSVAEEWRLYGRDVNRDEFGVTLAGLPGSPVRLAAADGPDAVAVATVQEPAQVPDSDSGNRPVPAPDRPTVLVRLTRETVLAPGVLTELWWVLGLDEAGWPAPARPADLWDASVRALAQRLPRASAPRVPELVREIPWHVALLTGGACTDGVLGGHTLDQGSAYSFDLQFNGAARDPLQHALPLVYCEPDLALSVLRNTCAWAGPDGELPYALDSAKHPVNFGYRPSDQALWALWLAAEYTAATGDVAALRALAPFHPSFGADPAPLADHLVGQFRHLVDVIGVGERGHIRIGNADWNDSALTLAGIDPDAMRQHGESVLNSAMAAWVLPRFAGMLRRLDEPRFEVVASESDALAERWRLLVSDEFNGRWYRRAYGPGAVVGDEDLWLEVQPWAILCGATAPDQAGALLRTIDEVVRLGSPLGARVRGPAPIKVPEGRVAGEGSAGGVWFSINMTLAWAALAIDPELAWDELHRMTLANHTELYPQIWEGTISGPDAYNTPESPRPGATWAWPLRGLGMQTFPVNNLHAHAQVVFTYLRLLGVEPQPDGSLRVDGRDGSFTSPLLRLNGDGHGELRTRGPVTLLTPAGTACAQGDTLRW